MIPARLSAQRRLALTPSRLYYCTKNQIVGNSRVAPQSIRRYATTAEVEGAAKSNNESAIETASDWVNGIRVLKLKDGSTRLSHKVERIPVGIRTSTAGSDAAKSSPTSLPWLRDHCQCSECIHPATKQRQLNIFQLHPDALQIKDCQIDEDNAKLVMSWNDGHRSEYDIDQLRRSCGMIVTRGERRADVKPEWWTKEIVNGPEVEVQFEDVMRSDEGLAEWTSKIRRFGFCFVADTPLKPEATQALLERIGPIRNTHYGGFYDFTSDLSSKDTAYTSEALDVHTDTNYFTEPARLQMFHLLQHEGTGGETQLADGFRAAKLLQEQSNDSFSTLSQLKMFFHASGNEGLSIRPLDAVPTLQRVERKGQRAPVYRIRWNNADRGAFVEGHHSSKIDNWYSAAREFDRILHSDDASVRYEFPLKPGRPLIFDNWRVLHGRSAFTGLRRMCGGYINSDDFISRYRTSNFGYEEVLKSAVF